MNKQTHTNNSSTHANAELLLVCRKTGSVHCTVYTQAVWCFMYNSSNSDDEYHHNKQHQQQ